MPTSSVSITIHDVTTMAEADRLMNNLCSACNVASPAVRRFVPHPQNIMKFRVGTVLPYLEFRANVLKFMLGTYPDNLVTVESVGFDNDPPQASFLNGYHRQGDYYGTGHGSSHYPLPEATPVPCSAEPLGDEEAVPWVGDAEAKQTCQIPLKEESQGHVSPLT